MKELEQALALVGPEQLGSIAAGVAEGRVVELRPDPRSRPEWLLDSGPPDLPGGYKLWRVGGDRVHRGERDRLLQVLRTRLRAALEPYEGTGRVPPWVQTCRLAQVAMMALEPRDE